MKNLKIQQRTFSRLIKTQKTEILHFRSLKELVEAKNAFENRTVKDTLKKNGFYFLQKLSPRYKPEISYRSEMVKHPNVFLCVQNGTRSLKAIKVIPNMSVSASLQSSKANEIIQEKITDYLNSSSQIATSRLKMRSKASNKLSRKKIEHDLSALNELKGTFKIPHVEHIISSCSDHLKVLHGKSLGKDEERDPSLSSKAEENEKQRVMRLLNRTSTETEVLSKLYDHPFVSNLKQSFSDEYFKYLVFSFYQGGTLHDLLHENGGKLGEDEARFLAAELLLGINFLQDNDVVHRDIKPDNILIDQHGHLRITDFGLSTRLKYGNKNVAGTAEYIPFEVLTESKYSSRYLDYWAFGIVLYKMLAGYTPFSFHSLTGERAISTKDVFSNILTSELVFPEHFSAESKDLLTLILSRDYDKRIKGKHIMFHPFFEGLDFDLILKKLVDPPLRPKLTEVQLESWNQKKITKDVNKSPESRRRARPQLDLSFL